MAQGDSISGIIVGEGVFDIRPLVGQVWLITFLNDTAYVSSDFTDGTNFGNIPSTFYNNPNIKLFIDNSYWIQVSITNPSSNYYFTWTGVQFK